MLEEQACEDMMDVMMVTAAYIQHAQCTSSSSGTYFHVVYFGSSLNGYLPVDAATAPMSTGGIPNVGMRNAAA